MITRILLLLALASPLYAQGVGPDNDIRDAARLEDAGHRKAADITSTVLVATALALPCLMDRTTVCVVNEAVQVSFAVLFAEATKHIFSRNRPNGKDDKSFFSEHTELACVAVIRTKAFALCPAVGYLRIASDYHWGTDVGVGALSGALLTTMQWGK